MLCVIVLLNVIMLSVIMLSVIMLIVIMFSVIMLNVIMLSAMTVAPVFQIVIMQNVIMLNAIAPFYSTRPAFYGIFLKKLNYTEKSFIMSDFNQGVRITALWLPRFKMPNFFGTIFSGLCYKYITNHHMAIIMNDACTINVS
jgi:hypothetical protein